MADTSQQTLESSPPRKRHALSGKRLWVFRLLAITIVPALLLLVVEGVLRLGGYGYSADFFVRDGNNDTAVWTENPQYTWRFFPRKIARKPLQLEFPAQKPESVYRIFVLGESAAMGDPWPTYGFSEMLRVMLEDRYPNAHFEVVNTGVTAISSTVVADIASDCVKHDPDLIIGYIGNNEIVGPYGPGTIFTPLLGSCAMVKLHMAAKASKMGQLMESLVSSVSSNTQEPEKWEGMGHFINNQVRETDPRLERAYSQFTANLQEIASLAKQHDTPLILCTIGTNLRDNAPFASLHRINMTGPEYKQWLVEFDQGTAAQANANWRKAIEHFEAALTLDDEYAEAHFRLAQCLLESGDGEEAKIHFLRARDTDALRFRADTRINNAIRDVAKNNEAPLVDIDKLFGDSVPDGIPGEELLYEHVHMTFRGNYLIARALAEELEPLLPEAKGDGDDWASEDDVAALLCYTGFDEYQVADKVLTRLRRAPFTNQFDHSKKLADWIAHVHALQVEMKPEQLRESAEQYKAFLAEHDPSFEIRSSYSEILFGLGRFQDAIEQIQTLIDERPAAPKPYDSMGRCLMQSGKYDEAEKYFTEALELDPELPNVHFNLAVLAALGGKFDTAIVRYEEGRSIQGESVETLNQLAALNMQKGKKDAGLKLLERSLDLRPQQPLVQYQAGKLLREQKKNDAAIRRFELALQAAPRFPEAANELGQLYLDEGRIDEAIELFEGALALKPKLREAQIGLDLARNMRDQRPKN